MTVDIHFHDTVQTADGRALGVAQRIYRVSDDNPMDPNPDNEHLKVVDLGTGENFYVPLDHIDGRSDGTVALDVSYREVLNSRFDHLPRYIAYEEGTREELIR